MWTGYKILILSYLTTEIWMERQYLSQREVHRGANFTRNHTILEGCHRDGQRYEEGSVIKENCNSCTCSGQQWKCSQHVCLVQPGLIEHVNKGDYGWTAQNYSQFWGMTLEEGFKYRLGTMPPSPLLLSMNEVAASLPETTDLPEFFIASYKWPGWTHGPLDQKNCAASWAFSTASVAADRIAIQSKGRYTANLSPQNLISCCGKNHYGCNSGSIDRAWWYLRKRGLVSHACYPLFKDQNATNNGCAMTSRSDGRGKRHATKPCPNSIEKSNRIYQCSPPYRVSSNETEIMKEIMQNGPVQAIMQVHEDFFNYKKGIYRHVTGTNEESEKYQKLHTHAVKLTGCSVTFQEGKWNKNAFVLPLELGIQCHLSSVFLQFESYISSKPLLPMYVSLSIVVFSSNIHDLEKIFPTHLVIEIIFPIIQRTLEMATLMWCLP
ncbi:tubulointerstitial nephritis antigen isoform X5 [Phocoena sinus]|uniref:tubulointerstitial nephritis antigen isoform X5 n=1 Tax=Phocoena sinus TaxID=42100 RepID=UPI0013C4643B|nr:tubulointerstitial nephritis antigen isoform X5 [Phocoena sinus]